MPSDTTRNVLLVGASARWAAQSARHAGFRVIAMDRFGDTDTIAAAAKFIPVPPNAGDSIPRSNLRGTIESIARREQAEVYHVGGLIGDDANEPISPDELKRFTEASGFAVPEIITKLDIAGPAPGRWLVKKFRSAGGLGVHFLTSADGQTLDENSYLQRWVPGRTYGLVAIADETNCRVVGITRSLHQRLRIDESTTFPFAWSGARSVTGPIDFPWMQFSRIAADIAKSRQLRGLFNLDWVHDRNGRWFLLEVNERPSGSCEILERSAWATGMLKTADSLMAMHIAAHQNELEAYLTELPSSPVPLLMPILKKSSEHTCWHFQRFVHLKRVVYSQRDGLVRRELLDRVRVNNLVGVDLADIPADSRRVCRGEPIATLLIDIDTQSMPLQHTTNLRQLVESLRSSITD